MRGVGAALRCGKRLRRPAFAGPSRDLTSKFPPCISSPARSKPQLRLVVTSATLDGEKFSKYFNDCPVFHVRSCCFIV